MTASSRAPFYDLFKLIVATILLLIFFKLWMRPSQTQPPENIPVTFSPLPSSPSTALKGSPTAVPDTSTPIPPSNTPTPMFTATSLPTATATLSLTETPVPETLPTPIVEIPTATNVCEATSRSQLQVGMKATIVRRLNFRSSPGILDNWILTNVPNTQVEIVGGPECTRYLHGGSYLWWQIKLPNGLVGWSAEASAFGKFYFMEPVR